MYKSHHPQVGWPLLATVLGERITVTCSLSNYQAMISRWMHVIQSCCRLIKENIFSATIQPLSRKFLSCYDLNYFIIEIFYHRSNWFSSWQITLSLNNQNVLIPLFCDQKLDIKIIDTCICCGLNLSLV